MKIDFGPEKDKIQRRRDSGEKDFVMPESKEPREATSKAKALTTDATIRPGHVRSLYTCTIRKAVRCQGVDIIELADYNIISLLSLRRLIDLFVVGSKVFESLRPYNTPQQLVHSHRRSIIDLFYPRNLMEKK